MNPDSNCQNSVNDNKPKALLTKIKRSRFQRTDSIPAQEKIDPSRKIPLSSSTKKNSDQPSQSNTKLNAMYPRTLLGPVKYSIINRQVSEPPDFSQDQTKFLMSSSAAVVQEKSDGKNTAHNLNSSKNKIESPHANNQLTSEDAPNASENQKLSDFDKKNDFSSSSVKSYSYYGKKKGRKKKIDLNVNKEEEQKEEVLQQEKKQNNNNNKIKSNNEFDIHEENGNLMEPINKSSPENIKNFDEKKVTINNDQFIKPMDGSFMISRTMSAGNPSSDTHIFLDRAVNYLINKRKIYFGEGPQIYRTNSKTSSSIPKTPFEYVASRPAPILSQYRNLQISHKLLKSSVDEFPCSHSDDEAQEIYEIIKSKMNFTRNRSNNSNNSFKNTSALKSENENIKKTTNNSDMQSEEKENESVLKSKKPKHFYGENTSLEVMNFLKSRINWDSSQNDKRTSNSDNAAISKTKSQENVISDDVKRFASLPLNKVTVSKQTSAILKKFEKANSIISNSNTDNDAKDFISENQQEPDKKPFIPPYFRENQKSLKENENKIKKTPKKKISNVLDIEKLNQMQDVTRQYGIFDEVYRPFAFKKAKKTSSDEIDKMLDFSNFDGFFDMDDADMESFFS